MAIKDLIRRWREKRSEKTEELNRIARVQHFQEKLDERKMDSNERELIRFQEEERKAAIKEALDGYRARERDRVWRGKEGNPAYLPNVIKNQKSLFSGKSMFSNKTQLKQPNLFFKNG